MEERVKQALLDKAVGGRMTCAEARSIAESLGVPYLSVGMAATAVGIKIKNCELGCF